MNSRSGPSAPSAAASSPESSPAGRAAPPQQAPSAWLRHGPRVLAMVVVVALCWWGLRQIDGHKVLLALSRARLWPVALAATINFFHLYCRALRWRALLSPVKVVGRLRLFHYMVVGSAVSIVLPLQGGEALRLYILRRRDGVPLTASLGAIAIEKVFDVIGILLMTAPLPYLLPLPPSAKLAIKILVLGGILALTGAITLAVWMDRHGPPAQGEAPDAPVGAEPAELSLRQRFSLGLAGVRQPGPFLAALGWTLGGVLTDCVAIWLVFLSLDIHLPVAATALVLLTVNVAIAVPSTPGNLGALEAGAAAGLMTLGVAEPAAVAFAIVYHMMQLVPVLLAGLSGLHLAADLKVSREPAR